MAENEEGLVMDQDSCVDVIVAIMAGEDCALLESYETRALQLLVKSR